MTFWISLTLETVSPVMIPGMHHCLNTEQASKEHLMSYKGIRQGWDIQMPNIALRTGAFASVRHCVSKQSNDKECGRREETPGRKTVGRNGGQRNSRVVCGILRLYRMKGSLGKENCMLIEVQLFLRFQKLSRQVLGHFTQHWTFFSQPWQVSNGQRAGSSMALKEVSVRELQQDDSKMAGHWGTEWKIWLEQFSE